MPDSILLFMCDLSTMNKMVINYAKEGNTFSHIMDKFKFSERQILLVSGNYWLKTLHVTFIFADTGRL